MHVANAENEGPDKTDMTADDFFVFKLSQWYTKVFLIALQIVTVMFKHEHKQKTFFFVLKHRRFASYVQVLT